MPLENRLSQLSQSLFTKKEYLLAQKKTEAMITAKKNNELKWRIMVVGTILKQVNNFKYLGTAITLNSRCTAEVKCRIGQAKAALKNFPWKFENRY
jgi:hypothetical protein